MSDGSKRLEDFEEVVEDLVVQMQVYQSASAALRAAIEACRSAIEQSEAVKHDVHRVSETGQRVFAELSRLEPPKFIAELERLFDDHEKAMGQHIVRVEEAFLGYQAALRTQSNRLVTDVRDPLLDRFSRMEEDRRTTVRRSSEDSARQFGVLSTEVANLGSTIQRTVDSALQSSSSEVRQLLRIAIGINIVGIAAIIAAIAML
jgi:hypothetical protein